MDLTLSELVYLSQSVDLSLFVKSGSGRYDDIVFLKGGKVSVLNRTSFENNYTYIHKSRVQQDIQISDNLYLAFK